MDFEARDASFSKRVSCKYCMKRCIFFLTIDACRLNYRRILESVGRRNKTWQLLKVLTGDLFALFVQE